MRDASEAGALPGPMRRNDCYCNAVDRLQAAYVGPRSSGYIAFRAWIGAAAPGF
jgi:hypothetical protein